MAIRVDRPGLTQLLDGVGIGATGSGVPVYDDGITDSMADRPWAGKESYISSEAMRMARVPASEIMKIRPPVPQYLFPPNQRFDREALTIEEVLDTDRWTPQIRSWTSPDLTPNVRSDDHTDGGSGNMRNVSSSVNPMG